ncbi:uncharacterized protein ACA1_379280 [Acanthamoeba castellanii str. Neff]|uniref:UBZ4-type domain-containing protein n=1 Tax=Acanthamoeba castellanii (strain ATCC 30010 / Neff) TaxID=1257118 RepID=L8GUG3_ACACF|nr:uncharacterized protein ACA1_379280 [Acanthamoeba castellanii str. Neff]ELR15746.1 hypothetical protein ACA1_379280 [Acanthamoeba castellanii str. Neff]
MSSQPAASTSKHKGSSSGKRRGNGAAGGSQRLFGTPLDIAALPSANQVTLHSDEDSSDQPPSSQLKKTRLAKRKVNKPTSSADELVGTSQKKMKMKVKKKVKEVATPELPGDSGGGMEKEKEKETKPSKRAASQDALLDERRQENNKLREQASSQQHRADDSISTRRDRANPVKEEKEKENGRGQLSQKEKSGRMEQEKSEMAGHSRTYIDLSQDSDEGGEEEEEEEIPLTQREKASSVATERSEVAPDQGNNGKEEEEEEEEEADRSMALVTKRRYGSSSQQHRKKPKLAEAKRRPDGKSHSSDELDFPATSSSANIEHDEGEEEAGSIPKSDQDSHDEEEEEDEAEAEAEAETTGGEKQRVRLGSDSSELKAAEEPNEAQARERDEQPPGWYRKAGREEMAQSDQTDARFLTTPTAQPSADQTPSQKERKRRAKGKEKAPAPPDIDEEDERGRGEEEEEDEITGSQMPAAKPVVTRGEEEEHEEGEPLAALPSVCPMCSKSVKHMDLQAREAHVNSCIDSRQHTTADDPDFVEAFHCELCGKDMTKWNAQQRQQHMERCLDKFTDNISQQLTQQGSEPTQEDFGTITGSRSALVGRIDHLKKCARKHKLSVESFRNTKKWNEMVPAPPSTLKKAKTKRGATKKTTSAAAATKPKRTRKKKTTMADAAAEAAEAAAASEVRSKFFGDELATVSHANFLATIAKLRYKQGGASDGAAPATSTSTGPDAGPAAKALGAGAAVAQPQELGPTVAVMAASSASSSSSTSSVVDKDDGEDDFAADPQFKRPPAVAPKGRKTRVKKLNYDDLVAGMGKEDEELMLAVALSNSLAPAPPAPVLSSPESSPRDLAGFKLGEEQPKMDEAAVSEVMKDLFPDDGSQEIRPTPRLAESTLARRSPQPPGRTSLWNLSSSVAGAYDPVFIRTNVLLSPTSSTWPTRRSCTRR